jgi:hypothetical protein
MLSFRAGNPDRPRGHALLFFRDADEPHTIWATYLIVAPIQMDLAKYVPAAFAPQLAGQLGQIAPAAYPLPPMPEKIDGGLEWLERVAEMRGDDLLDGGTLRLGEPWQTLHPINDIGAEYAERCTAFFESAPAPQPRAETAASDVDELLLQVMPDREKISRLARLTGTLRYAAEGSDQRLVDETVSEMTRVARHLGDKYRSTDLIQAARSTEPGAGQLVELYIERCYKLADEDYAALADLDRRIDELRGASSG